MTEPKNWEAHITEPTHEQKLIHYLTNVVRQAARTSGRVQDVEKPDWVPCRVRIASATAEYLNLPTETTCESNVWGAIFLQRGSMSKVALYVWECEILELRANVKKHSEEASK